MVRKTSVDPLNRHKHFLEIQDNLVILSEETNTKDSFITESTKKKTKEVFHLHFVKLYMMPCENRVFAVVWRVERV